MISRIGFWLAGLCVALVVVVRTPFLADMSVFLPQRPSPEQRMLIENLRTGVVSRLMLVGIDGVASSRQAALSAALAERLRAEPAFRAVNNGERSALAADEALLFERRYLLSAAVTPARFEEAGLRAALQDAIDALGSSAGLFTKQLLTRDPTGELLALLSRLEAGAAPALQDGVWVSADRRRVMMLLYTVATGSDLDGQQQAIAVVRRAFDQAVAATQTVGARLVVSGPGVFAVESRDAIRGDVERLSTFGVGLIMVVLLLIFRSPLALGLTLVPMLSAVLAGMTAVALLYGSIHGLTLGFGTTLVGEAVDYALYHLIRQGSLRGLPPAAAVDRTDGAEGSAGAPPSRGAPGASFWATIRLGVATSIIGFSALLFSGFPGLAQLAVFSIAGLLIAATVTRFVLPALTPQSFRPRDLTGFDALLHRWLHYLQVLRWPLAALVVAALVTIWSQRNQLWDPDIASLNPVSAASVRLDEQLREALGAPDARTLVIVTAVSEDAALQAAEDVAATLENLVGQGVLGGYESPATFLPSLRTQRLRQAALPDEAALGARLARATDGLPLRADRLAPFVADVARAKAQAPLTRADLANTQLGIRVESLLARYGDRFAVLMPIRAAPGRALDTNGLARALPRLDPAQVTVLDLKEETDRLYAGYLHEAGMLSLGGSLAIVALLALSIRSLPGVLMVCAPLAGAVVLVIAGFALAGQRMNLLHLVGLLLVVAVGSNYALFFRYMRHGGQANPAASATLASLVFANLTTVIGFGVLSVSRVPLLSALGTTVGAGAALALALSCVWLGRRG